MIVVDAHQDIAYNSLSYNRDYRQSALLHRRREAGTDMNAATIGLPDALLGRVGVIFATLFVAPARASWSVPGIEMSYDSPQKAYAKAMQQLDYYNRIADEDERLELIHTQSDLERILATWKDGVEVKDHRQGLVVLMEGADPVIEPQQFAEWYERGVRIVGTSWGATRYAGGTSAPGGLTSLGRDLLEVMAGYNCLLDLSHMAEAAFYDAVDQYEGPIIASHSNPRKFVDTDRHLSDDMIRRLAERDGVMGVVLFNRFLSMDWKRGDDKSTVPLTVVLDVIDHICQLTGSARHVGIGSDFDGGFGAESIPEGLDTSMDLLKIGDGLRERGYDAEDVAAILGQNMLRKLQESLPV